MLHIWTHATKHHNDFDPDSSYKFSKQKLSKESMSDVPYFVPEQIRELETELRKDRVTKSLGTGVGNQLSDPETEALLHAVLPRKAFGRNWNSI